MNYTTSPAFTLSLKGKTNILQMPDRDYSSPGPKYNTWGLGQTHEPRSSKIGKSKRTDINHWVQQTPSPNHYQLKQAEKQHAVSIPKSKHINKVDHNPSSACYNPQEKNIRPATARYSMTGRYCSIMDSTNNNPGPADYQATHLGLSHSKSYRQTNFSSTQRFKNENSNPGVGDYQISARGGFVNGKGSIGTGEREPIAKPNYPSPDEYRKLSCFDISVQKQMGKSMSAKLAGCFQENRTTEQAFNKYFQKQHPSIGRTSQKYTIGKTKREIFQTKDTPSPADYMASDECIAKNSFRATINKHIYHQYNDVEDNPGPGAYRPVPPNTIQYTIPRAKSAALMRDVPGVGRYKLQGSQSKQGFPFPKSQRTNFISKNIAGVGDYCIEQKREIKGTIGKASRFKVQQKLPGPGDYHLHSILGYRTKKQ